MTGPVDSDRPLVIWRLLDGKPGHEAQSLGLNRALARLMPVKSFDLSVSSSWRAWWSLLSRRCALGQGLPSPDLLLGAGHATHPWLLACRRARGGRAVVLMKPSLPTGWFDLCLVPEHDGLAGSDAVLTTRGVLNPMHPGTAKDPALGLLLIGGPSAHYGWDADALLAQLQTILERDDRHWLMTSSRRTPAETEGRLASLRQERLQFIPAAQTPPGWVAEQLDRAACAWVTEDSVSMVYESLTAGAACGLLPVPVKKDSRVRHGVQQLIEARMVTPYADWQNGQALQAPDERLDEATRCATWIRDKWFAS